MRKYFAYIRVSDARQGNGVSLPQQREFIERHARQKGGEVIRWFEEKKTAAKAGRKLFNEIVRLLRAGAADGIIVHKVDRSSRNWQEWGDFTDLLSHGIDVQFAGSSIDMNTIGGRLTADIEAAVAVHYIRNLREEAKKGFYGRLKQGLFPMRAPLGYLDAGSGKPKTIDPARGPLVKRMFELYATGRYTKTELAKEMFSAGLRSRNGKKLDKNLTGKLLSNPFYIGLIQIKKTNQSFAGIHKPLIAKSVFDQAQTVLVGRPVSRKIKHDFRHRRFLQCANCNFSLIGESQKGHVYYRCHTKNCATKGFREEEIDKAFSEAVKKVTLTDSEERYFEAMLSKMRIRWEKDREIVAEATSDRLKQLDDRIARLTDVMLDGYLDRETFEERKKTLTVERLEAKAHLDKLQDGTYDLPGVIAEKLELARPQYLLSQTNDPTERREILESITSNRAADHKALDISLKFPFSEFAKMHESASGGPSRALRRTCTRVFDKICEYYKGIITDQRTSTVSLRRDICSSLEGRATFGL